MLVFSLLLQEADGIGRWDAAREGQKTASTAEVDPLTTPICYCDEETELGSSPREKGGALYHNRRLAAAFDVACKGFWYFHKISLSSFRGIFGAQLLRSDFRVLSTYTDMSGVVVNLYG